MSSSMLPPKSIKPLPGAPSGRSIDVYCRVRPIPSTDTRSPYYDLDLETNCVGLDAPDDVLKRNQGIKKYFFTKLFGPDSTQEDVYMHIVKDLIGGLVSHGRNGLVFSYGVTNAGKTHTIVGKNDGILPRILQDLIHLKHRVQAGEPVPGLDLTLAGTSSSSQTDYSATDVELTMECFEIYNEDIFDLNMKEGPKRQSMLGGQYERPKLKIKDNNRKMVIEDIRTSTLTTLEESFATVERCLHNRQVAATALNANSSRSHTVFKISATLLFRHHGGGADAHNESEPLVHKQLGYLCVVDLAGSERMKRTETGTGDGKLKEACGINNSLLVLGRCLQALQKAAKDGNCVVPFRDCKLTKFLAEFFQYTSTIKMITNINPRTDDFAESLRVLNYASIAKEVKLITSEFKSMRLEGQQLKASAAKRVQVSRNSMPGLAELDQDGLIADSTDHIETLRQARYHSRLQPVMQPIREIDEDALFQRLEDRIKSVLVDTLEAEHNKIKKMVSAILISSLSTSRREEPANGNHRLHAMSEPRRPQIDRELPGDQQLPSDGPRGCITGGAHSPHIHRLLKRALQDLTGPSARDAANSPLISTSLSQRSTSSNQVETRQMVNRRKLKHNNIRLRQSKSEDPDDKKRAGRQPVLGFSKQKNSNTVTKAVTRSGPARSTEFQSKATCSPNQEDYFDGTPRTPDTKLQPKRSSFYDTLMKEPKVKEQIALEISLKEHRKRQEEHLRFYLGVCDGNMGEAIKFFHQEYNMEPDADLVNLVAGTATR